MGMNLTVQLHRRAVQKFKFDIY
ncbi:uncharacterized protein G2W53_012596 [Senna tora]|uniref:Uncharacterized protein n=1 Tax=Senna tora TaxID=362788 RepID=A0A834TX14_9FABA|nr:uncharacterized protein G2W53_012596 [Senna tora]